MTIFVFEPSGKLKLPSDAELAAADETSAVLAYSTGVMDNGRPYWAYIAVKPSLYRKFRQLTAERQQLVLQDYGTVLVAGYDTEPPPEIVMEMQVTYGFDPNYREKIVAEINQQQEAAVAKQENERLMDIVTMLKKKQQA